MIFPIFDFDILRCFPELIASARAPENCPASPHLQHVANIAGAGESLSRIRSTSSQASFLAIYLALLLWTYSAGRRGGGKKCTHWIWKRNCFYGPIENWAPQRLANQNKRNSFKKRSYYSFIQTRTERLSEAGIRHATHYDYITRSRNTEVYFAQNKQF